MPTSKMTPVSFMWEPEI